MTNFPRPRPDAGRVLFADVAFVRVDFFAADLATVSPFAASSVARRLPADGVSVIALVSLHGISSVVITETRHGQEINGRFRERGETLVRVRERCQERMILRSIS